MSGQRSPYFNQYFNQYEFTCPHLLSASDCESISIAELRERRSNDSPPREPEHDGATRNANLPRRGRARHEALLQPLCLS